MRHSHDPFFSGLRCYSMLAWLREGEKGVARVVHREVSDAASLLSIRRGDYVRPGTYVCLEIAGQHAMSDTEFERESNEELLRRAHGDVLIAGLGIGLVILPLMENPAVRSVTVIEKHQDVIELVEPCLRLASENDAARLTILRGDIFDWRPPRGQKFNTLYFDIWPTATVANLKEMQQLHRIFRRYKERKDIQVWMSSWMFDLLKANKTRPFKKKRI